MNEYTLRLQGEKIERLILQHRTAVEQFNQQCNAEPKTGAPPPAVLAAERALRSNSTFLMRSSEEPLIETMLVLKQRINTIYIEAGRKDTEESLKLRDTQNRWNDLVLALRDRAEALEKAAEEKRKRAAEMVEWHKERRQNAEATKQCAIDRARCLAHYQEGNK